jgi:hypothetical protein
MALPEISTDHSGCACPVLQGSPAPRSRPPHHQQQQSALGQLQLAGLAPCEADEVALENCGPPAGVDTSPEASQGAAGTPAEAGATAAAETAVGACGSSSDGSSRATSTGSNQSGTSTSTSSNCGSSSSSSAWHLPSIQHSHQQQACSLAAHGVSSSSSSAHADQACTIGSAAAAGFEQPTTDAANWDGCGEPSEDALFGPCGTGSRGAVGWQMPSAALNSSNSNILALQQRLLLPACVSGLARTTSSGSSCGLLAASRQSATGVAAQPAAGPRISASGGTSVLMRGVGPTPLQAAAPAPGFCLHTRMATTAARAQLLLTRDLTTVLTPHAPRVRPGSGQGGAVSSTSTAVAADSSREQQPWEQPSPQHQQLGGSVDAVPTLRFVSSSRPSSASRCGRTAVAAATTSTYAATSAPSVPSCVLPETGLTTAADADCALYSTQAGTTSSNSSGGGCSGSGGVVASRPVSGLRRPVSASLGGATRWGSRTGSDSGPGSSSSRPGSSGVPLAGASAAGEKAGGVSDSSNTAGGGATIPEQN